MELLVGFAGAAMGLTPEQCGQVWAQIKDRPLPFSAESAAQEFLIAVLQVKGI